MGNAASSHKRSFLLWRERLRELWTMRLVLGTLRFFERRPFNPEVPFYGKCTPASIFGGRRFSHQGAFMDSTGVVRAWVAGSGDASALLTLKPIKWQTTKQLRFRSLRNCDACSRSASPMCRDEGPT